MHFIHKDNEPLLLVKETELLTEIWELYRETLNLVEWSNLLYNHVAPLDLYTAASSSLD